METLELFYPQISARAGPYTFDKGVEIEVYSSKPSYFDWAKIRCTEQCQPKIALKKKMCIRDSIRGAAAAAVEGVKGIYTAGFSFLDNLTGGRLSAIRDKFVGFVTHIALSLIHI